jgi:prepilin-type N-terminal cleavage/methylation domain-containing protein
MKQKWRCNNKGLTLIELIIVLALMGLVLTGAYALFFIGNTIFSHGESQYGLQSEARLAIESMTNEIRYATHIRLAENTEDPSPYETLLYYDTGTNTITKKFGETVEMHSFVTDTIAPPLAFTASPVNSSIEYTLEGEDARYDRIFSLVAQINLLNIHTTDSIDGEEGTVLAYITPEAYRAQNLDPTVTIPTPDPNTFDYIAMIYSKPPASFIQPITVSVAKGAIPLGSIGVLITQTGVKSSIELTLNIEKNKLKKDDNIVLTLIDKVDAVPFIVNLLYDGNKWNPS